MNSCRTFQGSFLPISPHLIPFLQILHINRNNLATDFSLRTYVFIVPVMNLASFLNVSGLTKLQVFYAIRFLIGSFSAYCEASFVDAVGSRFQNSTAKLTCIMLVLSPGECVLTKVLSLLNLPSKIDVNLFLTSMSINSPIFTLLVSGVFYASTSYLPSALCSSLLMLSISSLLRGNFVLTIFTGCAAVVWTGWPFAGRHAFYS